MEKLILQNHLSPGDVVMLTAAVRDLHLCYPGRYLTDVRTSCGELWENNPFITPLSENEPGVRTIECECPLINRSNRAPYHYLHGFIEFLNDTLGLQIRPTAFKGDVYLSPQEKAWFSQVAEVVGEEIPFWIVAAGGKFDVTIKWWDPKRYQEVIDSFRDRIQFVQIGAEGHYHPRLDGTIDLRGQTNLRELVRLVYHSQGILCGVTGLMHLAAAVELKPGAPSRPCVVVAGSREPAHWEAYPGHQFIANNGALSCSRSGGCWKARTQPLGDGDPNDRREHLCVDVVGNLPRCMDLITGDEVGRRIGLYFNGGVVKYLSKQEGQLARIGVEATQANAYDGQGLTFQTARLACEQFISRIPPYPGGFKGRGIVICGGGIRYFPATWVCINMLRSLGNKLPIELWHLGPSEMDEEMVALLRPVNVRCVDAFEVARRSPVRRLGGWELKPYAILNSAFREVLFLDADNVPVKNPDYLFDTLQFRTTGAIFWPDYLSFNKGRKVWRSCGIERPIGPEFESGQIVIDKKQRWQALRLALWFNEHSDFYYQHLHGDKETFRLAFHKLRKSYSFVQTPVKHLPFTMCQHDFNGRRVFQHRNTDKWNIFLRNQMVPGFRFEKECRNFVRVLQEKWDGGTGHLLKKMSSQASSSRKTIVIQACMISCEQRERMRGRTLRNLARTDWGTEPVVLQIDDEKEAAPDKRQVRTSRLLLERCLQMSASHILFLEDDLEFNTHLRHNLDRWRPLRDDRITVATLYNPNLLPLACHPRENYTLVAPDILYGSQALLISRRILKYLIEHWNEMEGNQDLRIARLAGRLQSPMFVHSPSLVEHVGKRSLWGGRFHKAIDFDRDWRA